MITCLCNHSICCLSLLTFNATTTENNRLCFLYLPFKIMHTKHNFVFPHIVLIINFASLNNCKICWHQKDENQRWFWIYSRFYIHVQIVFVFFIFSCTKDREWTRNKSLTFQETVLYTWSEYRFGIYIFWGCPKPICFQFCENIYDA